MYIDVKIIKHSRFVIISSCPLLAASVCPNCPQEHGYNPLVFNLLNSPPAAAAGITTCYHRLKKTVPHYLLLSPLLQHS